MEKVPLQDRLARNSRVVIPAHMHPLFRTQIAIEAGVERNLLFRTWGGLGDMLCAEPTLRYALKMFKNCDISLASDRPELFRHLKFKRVFDLKEESPNYDKYLLFDTITPPDDSNMVWLFFSHMLVNCVDFPSMCALRLQLPVPEKEIVLCPEFPREELAKEIFEHLKNGVVIHPGRHWQSKTFPKSFWDRVIASVLNNGGMPIIIGADTDDNRGTVDVNAQYCVDYRNKLSINDSIWLLKNAKVLLTNDSSPLHMAMAGDAWVGYVATCKHPDMISHWRNGIWNWREQNFGRGGIWDIIDFCPNKKDKVEAEFVPPEILESWLPDPVEFAWWAIEKLQ